MTINHEEFTNALKAEADLAEALLSVVSDKQKAIVGLNGDSILSLSRREEELVGVLRKLETERNRLAVTFGAPGKSTVVPRVHEILQRLDGTIAAAARKDVSRLRLAVERISAVNASNRTLLQHSLRFVQETLKVVTDDNRRKIVDARI